MLDRCIVTVGVGARYAPYLDRLISTFRSTGGYSGALLSWADGWPPGSPTHGDMHYAFKYYAVAEAKRRGFRQVVYLDATCYAMRPITPLWEHLEREGYYLAYSDDILGRWISDKALDYFGMTRDAAMELPLPAGAIVGLDFANEKASRFFEEWETLAKSGLFWAVHSEQAPDRMTSLLMSDNRADRRPVSTDPRCWGHRSDEACFAPLMQKLGMAPTKVGGIFGGGVRTDVGAILCGYNL